MSSPNPKPSTYKENNFNSWLYESAVPKREIANISELVVADSDFFRMSDREWHKIFSLFPASLRKIILKVETNEHLISKFLACLPHHVNSIEVLMPSHKGDPNALLAMSSNIQFITLTHTMHFFSQHEKLQNQKSPVLWQRSTGMPFPRLSLSSVSVADIKNILFLYVFVLTHDRRGRSNSSESSIENSAYPPVFLIIDCLYGGALREQARSFILRIAKELGPRSFFRKDLEAAVDDSVKELHMPSLPAKHS